MLTVDNVSVSYGPIRAVRDVSFRVEEGEVVALLGPNGAGKTSLLGAITGLVPVSGGAISFAGREITRQKPEDIARLGITMAPEGRQIFSKLTVAENLKLGGYAARARKEQGDSRWNLDRILTMFPVLQEKFNEQAETLSGGEQQQLAIARALMSDSKLLILDEPSLGLAPQIVDTIFDLIGTLASHGMTLLLVEQDAARALRIADQTVLLSAGEVEFIGGASELERSGDLMRAYFGVIDEKVAGTTS
jgi:branched-chain amino acid transport system ATP-binding protein